MCADSGTVKLISNVFDDEDVRQIEDYEGPESGQRRWEAASHEASLDLSDDDDQARLLRVYLSAIQEFGRSWAGDKLSPAAQTLVSALIKDGAPIDAEGNLTGSLPARSFELDLDSKLSRPEVLLAQLERINSGVRNDPALTIGSCKELIESICKFVLDDYGEEYGRTDNLPTLYKKTAQVLKLSRESVPESVRGSKAAHRALRSMTGVVQALAELRNELGIGHGHTAVSPALVRHARLTAAMATGLAQFLLDTWRVRRENDGAATALHLAT